MPKEPQTAQEWKMKFYELAAVFEEQDTTFVFAMSLLRKTRDELSRQFNACTNATQQENMGLAARQAVVALLNGATPSVNPSPKTLVTMRKLDELKKNKLSKALYGEPLIPVEQQ